MMLPICGSGEGLIEGVKLARTPIGTPRQASPSPNRPIASTARKGLVSSTTEGIRGEAMMGHQLARTPAGSASAGKLLHPASQNMDPQGTPGNPCLTMATTESVIQAS